MTDSIRYIERTTGEVKEESVYGGAFIKLLYSSNPFIRFLFYPFLELIARLPYFSRFYGYLQKLPSSRRKIAPFIADYHVDESEFLDRVETFGSFNDFFIRKLKPECRPIASGQSDVIIPADGRYRIFPDLTGVDGFYVKGKFFSLHALLQDDALAERYRSGSMIFGRLSPTDYHRFHFPFDCIPGKSKLINGALYSVNPIALKKNIAILAENKRMVTELDCNRLGKVLFIEIGATNVGSILQTYRVGERHQKGDEKGYFSFGGSALILLFERDRIEFSKDLLRENPGFLEIRCLTGQPLGNCKLL